MTGEKRRRPEWDAYFLAMALIASSRSTCVRRRVGAVIVIGNRILATGYNGSPAGTRHCTDIGCLRQELGIPSGERHEICRGSHAEMNAIAQAASSGAAINGCTIYCTHEPCSMCSKLLINAGCARAVYMYPYPDDLSRTLRWEARLASEVYEDHEAVMAVLGGTAVSSETGPD
jgi:dCMP deaminase